MLFRSPERQESSCDGAGRELDECGVEEGEASVAAVSSEVEAGWRTF